MDTSEQVTFNEHFAGWCPVDGRFCQNKEGCGNCEVKKEADE